MIQIIFGILFAFFIPGFLLTLLLFNNLNILEEIAFSISFSLIILLFLGLFLGVNETMANLRGGITEFNLWFYLIFLTILLSGAYLIKRFTSQN